MILLVTGGRRRADTRTIFSVLAGFHQRHRIDVLIEGGAWGADRIAQNWAGVVGVHVATVAAQWGKYGKQAGTARNLAMLALRPDHILAFPSKGSVGTWHCINAGKKLGIPVEIHEEDHKQ